MGTVIAPLQVGNHVLRVFSSNVQSNADEPHPPAVVSFLINTEKPWDQTSISFKTLSSGWHVLKAFANDPLNGTDVVGVTHNFYIDNFLPSVVLDHQPLQVFQDISNSNNNAVIVEGAVTSLNVLNVRVRCIDDNPLLPCQQVSWRLKGQKDEWTAVTAAVGTRT